MYWVVVILHAVKGRLAGKGQGEAGAVLVSDRSDAASLNRR